MKKTFTLIGVAALLATVSTPASAQTNLNLSNTGPYYSSSNSVVLGSGQLLANEQVIGGTTFDYTKGTNYLQQPIDPVGVTKSRYVSFGLTVVSTNSSALAHIAIIQGSTGSGDWLSLTPSLVVTTAAGAGTASTNTTYDTGGLTQFRTKSIQSLDGSGSNTLDTVSFSSKPGI